MKLSPVQVKIFSSPISPFSSLWYDTWETREFDSCILEKVVAGIDLPAFFVSNFMFYLVVINGNSIENMIY